MRIKACPICALPTGRRNTMSNWPAGCHSPNSCARHRQCMYIRCWHENDANLKSDIDKAVETEAALRAIRDHVSSQPERGT